VRLLVHEDDVAAAAQSGDGAEIGLKSGGEDDRGPFADESRDVMLELVVIGRLPDATREAVVPTPLVSMATVAARLISGSNVMPR